MRKIFVVILTLVTTLCWSLPASALLMPQMSIQELVTHANTIVSGKCLSFHYHPSPDGRTLYAIIQFKVEEYLKNDLGEGEVTVMHIAREEGVDGTRKFGDVSFAVDEEAVLFLTEQDNQGFRHVMGLPQGKFVVREDRGGRKTLVRDLAGVRFFDRKTGELVKIRGSREEKSLEEFRNQIKRIASELKAERQELLVSNQNTFF